MAAAMSRQSETNRRVPTVDASGQKQPDGYLLSDEHLGLHVWNRVQARTNVVLQRSAQEQWDWIWVQFQEHYRPDPLRLRAYGYLRADAEQAYHASQETRLMLDSNSESAGMEVWLHPSDGMQLVLPEHRSEHGFRRKYGFHQNLPERLLADGFRR